MDPKKFLICLGIIAFVLTEGSNGREIVLSASEEACLTPSRIRGSCVSIYRCSPLLNLLRESEYLLYRDKMILRSSQCGYERNIPKVCCPRNMQMTNPPPMLEVGIPEDEEIPPIPPDVSAHPRLGLINSGICGPISQSRIINGNKTAVLEYPWMALIAYNVGERYTDFRCGGSLINKRYVLTAAHCVSGLDSGLVLAGVRIGEHDLRTEIDCQVEAGNITYCAGRYQNFFIERLHVHHGYGRKKHENDIALIRMDGDADFGLQNIRPICLPVGDSSVLRAKKTVVITGWGKTETRWRSNDLLVVKLELVPTVECAEMYKDSGIRITERQICAGGKNRMDSCTGDSGGPLQYPYFRNGEKPKYVQYGLVSFGPENCGREGYPGVYTKVSYYMKWILDTIVE